MLFNKNIIHLYIEFVITSNLRKGIKSTDSLILNPQNRNKALKAIQAYLFKYSYDS